MIQGENNMICHILNKLEELKELGYLSPFTYPLLLPFGILQANLLSLSTLESHIFP